MFLSKHKNGIYYIYFFDPISSKRKSISTKCRMKKDALYYLSSFQKDIEYQKQNRITEISLKKFFWNFLRYSESVHSPNTTKTFKATFNKFEKYFGNILLSTLTKYHLSEYLEFRMKYSSRFQARKDLINLSSCFKKAVSENFISKNPCDGIKRIKIPEKQPRFFTKNEFSKLLTTIDDKLLKDIVIFAVNTGLRQMEILSLRWNQINLRENLLTLDNRNHLTKSIRVRTIPINGAVRSIIDDRMKSKQDDKIFHNPNWVKCPEQLSKTFKKYVIKANINPQPNFHSLRHTFASWLAQRGVSIYQGKQVARSFRYINNSNLCAFKT